MSEYQYYEFLAVDRPLNEEELDSVRSVSSRATITPYSFTNIYNWGDFSGSRRDFMRHFYDAHVYVANWMSAIFMLRLPKDVIPRQTAQDVAVEGFIEFDETPTHWVITWRLDESQDYERFGADAGPGWMTRLLPIRDELMRGDLRSLYIGWLAAISFEVSDDDEQEPFLPVGLGSLTSAQQALAEFIEVDEDLLAGSARKLMESTHQQGISKMK
jgi:hypothetical protein